MMNLVLALYAEGSTDDLFLPLVIQRTSRKVLAHHGQNKVSVLAVDSIKPNRKKREENILQAARQAAQYHALVVHSDADDLKPEKARVQRLEPGFRRVQQTKENVCKDLVPIIPIQAIEAWMLADHEILRAEMRTNLGANELGIPEKAKLVESISKPKQRLNEAVLKANKQLRPNQRIDLNSLYQPLAVCRREGKPPFFLPLLGRVVGIRSLPTPHLVAEMGLTINALPHTFVLSDKLLGKKIRLERLSQVPSYLQFVDDLTETLIAIDIIPRTHRM